MNVVVKQLEPWMRGTKFRPFPPPIFPDWPPSRDEVELAVELLDALDPESRLWYGEPLIERIRNRL
jgi:hypothetical protein